MGAPQKCDKFEGRGVAFPLRELVEARRAEPQRRGTCLLNVVGRKEERKKARAACVRVGWLAACLGWLGWLGSCMWAGWAS